MDPRLTAFRSRLGGVIAFPITPFHDDLSLDKDGLRRNLRALLESWNAVL
jgi:dihydrodipicolinate synthase/N-acetylneuraminate lyase